MKKAYKPKTLDEVLYLLDKYSENSEIIAGGTDIVIDLRNNKIVSDIMIDITNIPYISHIVKKDGYIEIGGGTTFTQIAESKILGRKLMGLKKACSMVGSPQIRNRGTVGGNIINGSPAADSVPPLIALDSEITLASINGERTMKIEDYYLCKEELSIKNNEILTNIKFKALKNDEAITFSKLGLRKALAISRISMSIFLSLNEEKRCKDIRIVSGALGKFPMREREVEKVFVDKKIDEDLVCEGLKVLEGVLDNRLKGRPTLEYKRQAVKGLFIEAMEDGERYFEEVIL
jgi:CO/xanthine dehydrogenase FAD-binding subunit